MRDIFAFLNGNFVLLKRVGCGLGVGWGVGVDDNDKGCYDPVFTIYELLFYEWTAPILSFSRNFKRNIQEKFPFDLIKNVYIFSIPLGHISLAENEKKG